MSATVSSKLSSSKRVNGGTKIAGLLLPVKYLRHVGNWIVAVFCYVAPRKWGSTKVSSSGTPKPLLVSPLDSQRAEAVKDCIDFINSSSSSSSTTCNPVSS